MVATYHCRGTTPDFPVRQCDCLGAFEALAKMRGINVIIIIIIIIVIITTPAEMDWLSSSAKPGVPTRRNHAGIASSPIAVGLRRSRILNTFISDRRQLES